MLDLPVKSIDESRQGAAYQPSDNIVENINGRRFYIESYGCQMNFSDSEIVASILQKEGLQATKNYEEADLIFINTCSIREKAEQTVRKRLKVFKKLKKNKPGTLVGVLGCMAERLKSKFLEQEQLVDIVVGPDAYRSLPGLIVEAEGGQKAVNVLLSREETYSDISPVRLDSNGVTAFISIMRGCNNMCTFCVVPFTRGRERSRDNASILEEARDLFDRGYREVTLLGQNVDSYRYLPTGASDDDAITFAQLLEMVAKVSPLLRVRFSTSHPKDITDDVLYTMKKYRNICNHIHFPVQSGSTRILQLMNRTYTKEWYLKKIDRIREIITDCSISSDVIIGFCTETEEDHQETMKIMRYSQYDLSYMFAYSERPNTLAERRFEDDVPKDVKQRRLQEIIDLQRQMTTGIYEKEIGHTYEVLIESESKRSADNWRGRNSHNKILVFPKGGHNFEKCDYVQVKVLESTGATLIGEIVA